MITIHKLLSRIRFDSAFGEAGFELEYEDRVSGIIKIPLEKIRSLDPLSFTITDPLGRFITIPLHRVRTVYRNGDKIWSRKAEK